MTKTGEHGYGSVTVDWRDGTIETYEGCSPDDWSQTPRRSEYHSHTYLEQGQYIVKILTDKFSCFFNRVRDLNYGQNNVNLLIAKTGKNIRLVNVSNCKPLKRAQEPKPLYYDKKCYSKADSYIEVFQNIVIKTNTVDYKSRFASSAKACFYYTFGNTAVTYIKPSRISAKISPFIFRISLQLM